MALIYRPNIFKQFPDIRAALSLRNPATGYGFNMSLGVGDQEWRVQKNRKRLVESLGFDIDRLAVQHQVHGDDVRIVGNDYCPENSDALITSEPRWLLATSVADCIPILVYDQARRVIAAIHSGWRGTQRNIAGKTLAMMERLYGSNPRDLFIHVGISASMCCYEVGPDVASAFDAQYSRSIGNGKYLFDNKGAALGQLLRAGVPSLHIELDPRCAICDASFHSYRRDRQRSGRMLGVIGIW